MGFKILSALLTVGEADAWILAELIVSSDVKQLTQSHTQESWDSIPDLSGGSEGHLQLRPPNTS